MRRSFNNCVPSCRLQHRLRQDTAHSVSSRRRPMAGHRDSTTVVQQYCTLVGTGSGAANVCIHNCTMCIGMCQLQAQPKVHCCSVKPLSTPLLLALQVFAVLDRALSPPIHSSNSLQNTVMDMCWVWRLHIVDQLATRCM